MTNFARLVYSVTLLATLGFATSASAQVAPPLGAAQSFAVLAGSAVTNTGSTVVTGDLGVSPGSAATGFPPGIVVSGTIHTADMAALAAQASAAIAFSALSAQACTQDLTGQDLGGLTLTPGVYCFSSSAQLTGALTLNALGNSNATFIFKIGTTLTTASASSVQVINGGPLCNIFWQVGSSATLGTNSALAGNLIAGTSITATTGARVIGRTLALGGAVTLDSSVVTATCAAAPVCPTIVPSPATLPNGTVASVYSQTLTASGGTAPYTYAIASGVLPAGLTLTAGGVLAGTPTTAGQSTVTVRVTDANGCSATRTYTITIADAVPPGCPVISLTPATLPDGRVAVAYSQTITGSGGTAPYTFTITAGVLPTGMTLTPTGLLAGTPATAGTTTATIRGTDANGCFASVPYSVVIATALVPPVGCPPIVLTPPTLPNATVGVPYSQTIVGSGGTAPYQFGVTAGTLPDGLTLTAGGVLAGTPTAAGEFSFTVRGTDANGCFAEVPYTMSTLTAVPTLPQVLAGLLALALAITGYMRLRRLRVA